MGNGIEKRNSTEGIANDQGEDQTAMPGVGGRQADPDPSPEGGGYQDICMVLNFRAQKKRDPRLSELYSMGLHGMWLEVAETIGVDNFLAMWRILDAHPSNYEDNGMKLIPLRRYSSFLRYQRNRYVEALFASGLTPGEIKERLSKQLGEIISIRHISRLRKPR
jgi:hypothetical protein